MDGRLVILLFKSSLVYLVLPFIPSTMSILMLFSWCCTGLRDCVKWMQGAEQEQGYFYDLVVRLRDDTFAFADWIFDSTEMKNALTR